MLLKQGGNTGFGEIREIIWPESHFQTAPRNAEEAFRATKRTQSNNTQAMQPIALLSNPSYSHWFLSCCLTCHHVWCPFSITGYLAHLNMSQSWTPLGWEVWSLIHRFQPLKENNFSLAPAPLPSSGKRASANCLHLWERVLSFIASTASLFLQVSGDTLPLFLPTFSHGLRLIHRGSGNYFPDFSMTSGLLSVWEDAF